MAAVHRSDRDFDIVLFGASGFVGALTAGQLAAQAQPETRIGLAGRSGPRVAEVRDGLPGAAREWPVLLADLEDPVALAGLAARTHVLISVAGPYLHRGLALVQACAEHGTDYVDLTGETLFVRRSIEQSHRTAARTGARIVHSCGFDSIPSDLGVGLNAAAATRDGEGTLTETVLHVLSLRGGISGGTVDSLRQQLLEVQGDPHLAMRIAHPHALVDGATELPRPESSGRLTEAEVRGRPISRDPDSGVWQAPFPMQTYNRQVVERSNALTDWGYGPDFRYSEVIDTGRGLPGALAAGGLVALTAGLAGGMSSPPIRQLLDRVLPAPGAGPSEDTRRGGRFLVAVESHTAGGAAYRTRIGAWHDPGYDGTAVMLAASALLLADDRGAAPDDDQFGDQPPVRGGVLTPMVALGDRLAGRLRDQQFTVQTERTQLG